MGENPIVPEEAIIPTNEPDIELELEDTEDVQAIRDKAEKMETFARQTLARAKKAEEELKVLKTPKPIPAQETLSQASVEETVLLANGMSEEVLSELKAIAAVRKVSLIKAQSDPLFVAAKEVIEKEKKQKEASLPVSRGSGQTKVKKDLRTPGLTRDEHKDLALKALGR